MGIWLDWPTMKTKLYWVCCGALGLSLTLAGCVRTVNDRTSLGVPLIKDRIVGQSNQIPIRRQQPKRKSFPAQRGGKGIVARADGEDGVRAVHAEKFYVFGLVESVAGFGEVHRSGREDDLGGDVGGDGGVEEQFAILFLPVAHDEAMNAGVADFGRSKLVVHFRSDDDLFVGRAFGLDAADVAEDPLIDRAEGIMGEGIHAGILETLFGGPAVPTFPDAGGALLDRKAPGGESIVVQQPIGEVGAANLREGEHQIFGADKTGGEMIIALFDALDQVLRSELGFLAGNEVEINGHRVGGLGVAFDFAVFVNVSFVERGADLFEERVEFGGVFGLADNLGSIGGEFGATGEVSGEDDVARGVGVDVEPITEAMELFGRQHFGRAAVAAKLDEALHRRVMALELALVSIDVVNRRGTDDAGIGPGGAAIGLGHFDRRHHGKLAVGALAVLAQVGQPFGEEGLHVGVHRGGADIDLSVAGPAHAFVALRAIGGDVNEVGALGVVNVFVETVQDRVGASEGTDSRSIAAESDADHGIFIGLGFYAGDLDVLEAVEGEARLPRFEPFAFADVGIRGAGAAEVSDINGPVRIQALGEAEGNFLAGFASNFEARDAGKILAKIEDEDAGLWLRDGLGMNFFEGADWRGGVRLHEVVDLVTADIDGLPLAQVATRLRPTGAFEPGVVGFAFEEIGFELGAGGGFPIRAGADVGGRAVGVFEVEFGAQTGELAVMIADVAVADVAAEPAVGEDRAESVFATADETRHIVGAVIDALVVISPAGSEVIIADALAVEVQVGEAKSGGVERGTGDGFVRAERRAQICGGRKEEVGEFEFAPGLRAVLGDDASGGPGRGVELPSLPIIGDGVR